MPHAVEKGGIDGLERDIHRRDLDFGEEPLLNVTEGRDGLLGEHEGGEHVLLGHLECAGLEHEDRVLGPGHYEVEIGVLGLVEGRVHDELAVLVAADAHARKRALERDTGRKQCRRRAHDRDDVGLVDLVG